MDNKQRLNQTRLFWDKEASSFDDAPDHGLRDPLVRKAWTDRLIKWLLSPPSAVLDIGCGTGSLSVVMAALGHEVTGIDLSPAMIAQAKAKAAESGYGIPFEVMDAADPEFAPQQFDVIVCRHLLWTLSEPVQVLQRWRDLLKPKGRLILIEGYWHTGAGLHSGEIVEALPASVVSVSVQDLSDQPELWGGEITDERYAVIANLPADTMA